MSVQQARTPRFCRSFPRSIDRLCWIYRAQPAPPPLLLPLYRRRWPCRLSRPIRCPSELTAGLDGNTTHARNTPETGPSSPASKHSASERPARPTDQQHQHRPPTLPRPRQKNSSQLRLTNRPPLQAPHKDRGEKGAELRLPAAAAGVVVTAGL